MEIKNNEVEKAAEEKKVITINLGYFFAIVMLVGYIGLAYALVFTELFSGGIFASYPLRCVFAVIFVAYAFFRAYRFIKNRGYFKKS